jgi:hypothetical protein
LHFAVKRAQISVQDLDLEQVGSRSLWPDPGLLKRMAAPDNSQIRNLVMTKSARTETLILLYALLELNKGFTGHEPYSRKITKYGL